MWIKIVKLSHGLSLPLPSYATVQSAGLDLYCALHGDISLRPGDRILVPTGIQIAIPPNFEGQIRSRSGLALNCGVIVLNAPGTIDADYRGEVKVILINLGPRIYTLSYGDRIAQLVIAPIVRVGWSPVPELEETARNSAGFGSSGI